MKKENQYDYLIPNTILERKKDYFNHQKKLDDIKFGKARRNISFFQQEDVKQNQKIKKTSFNYRQQEQQVNLYKQNAKMFFKLLNIGTTGNFSTIPQATYGGSLTHQPNSNLQMNTRDTSIANDIVSDYQKFEKISQLEQIVSDQQKKLKASNDQNTIERLSLNTQNKKIGERNLVSPRNAPQIQSMTIPTLAQNVSQKQNEFLDKVYKENLYLHQRLLEMDSVLNKRNFDKFHEKQQEYKNRIQRFAIDQNTQKVKMKYAPSLEKYTGPASLNKSGDDLARRKDGKPSQSPLPYDIQQNNLSKTEDSLKVKDNKSQIKSLTQKDNSKYSKYFFTEIDQTENESSKGLKNVDVKNWVKSKTRDQSLVKQNKTNNESRDLISYHRKYPSQKEMGIYSKSNNNRPKTNYYLPPQNNSSDYSYNPKKRSYTTSTSEYNAILGLNDKQQRIQNFKSRSISNKNIEYSGPNRPTQQQTQKMDSQFKNFFSSSSRSVSAKKIESFLRKNLLTNNRKTNTLISEQKNDLYNQNQVQQNKNTYSTRNQVNNYYACNNYSSGYKSNKSYSNYSTNNSQLLNNSSSRSYNLYNNDYKSDSQNRNKPYLKNNFINDSDKSNNVSQSAIYEQSQLKNISNTSNQEMRYQQRNIRNLQEVQKVVKMNQYSPYSAQNQQNFRRRIQTVHHYDRKQEYLQTPKPHPRILREQLVPLSQVKEEDIFQQTLDAKEIQKNGIIFPEKTSL